MERLPHGEYVIYLRKSRADLEAEARGEGETLAKHKKALFKLANHYKLNIAEVYEEIVSGERLTDRTEMLRLLDRLNDDPPAGVLVMDLDRLSRGSMQEQGFILETFRSNNVLIVTPTKVLDLNDESDEFQADISSLFARRELKMITRRLQRGRDLSAESGNFVSTRPPYGYDIHFLEDGSRTLKPNDQADIVRLMFQWADEGISTKDIAERLTKMNIPTYFGKKEWNFNVVLQILHNPVYIGRIQFRKTSRRKINRPDKKYDIKKRPADKMIDVQGKHPAIIDESLFRRVQKRLSDNVLVRTKKSLAPVNALAGIVKCGKCGFTMVYKRHPRNKELGYLRCNNLHCNARLSRYDLIEEKILNFLNEWLKGMKIDIKSRKPRTPNTIIVKEKLINELKDQLKTYEEQRMKQFDLLEQGIYTQEVFLERSRTLAERIEETTKRLNQLTEEIEIERTRQKNQKEIVPKVEQAIKYYKTSKDVQKKNLVLKGIIHEVKYWKEKNQTGDDFTIEITPKFPGE
jgi:DNA invertase Pin-like site-specific DNA recombinase